MIYGFGRAPTVGSTCLKCYEKVAKSHLISPKRQTGIFQNIDSSQTLSHDIEDEPKCHKKQFQTQI